MSNRFKDLKEISKKSIPVDFFYKECRNRFKLKKISAKKILPGKIIIDKNHHKPGLALAGYTGLFTHNRIQIFGNTEINYLKQLSKKERIVSLKRFFNFDMPCIIITDKNEVPHELLRLADEKSIPVFLTPYPTTTFIYYISDFLDDQFASQIAIHASFADVYGVGLLFCGNSGIGKSEVALDLVERGHRLVADDVVIVSKKSENVLLGSGTSIGKHFMEIRGLGILDIKQIFGIRAIRYQKRVEVIVELETWDGQKHYERTGLDMKSVDIMGVEIEHLNLPIFPGKNITVIAEVIALNYLCKHYGYDAAKIFEKRLGTQIKQNKKRGNGSSGSGNFGRSTEYFEHDFE